MNQVNEPTKQAGSPAPPDRGSSILASVRRFPKLGEETTPACVQTVMLSLAYNRGSMNKGLEGLGEPIERADWRGPAKMIGAMQQDHKLEGIRKRRRTEALYILTGLALVDQTATDAGGVSWI